MDKKKSNINSQGQSSVDLCGFNGIDRNIIMQGYGMKRLGAGPESTHYWEPRYFVLTQGLLEWYVDHQMQSRKGNIKIKAGTVCMTYDREKFDEGRRRFVWGVAKNAKSSPTLIDSYNTSSQTAWVKALEKQNCSNIGHVTPIKKNSESIKEGWLGKKEVIWGTRYVLLLPQLLMYFKWKRDKQPLAVVPFFKNTEVRQGKQETQFLLIDPSRKTKYLFRCYDKYACKGWMDAIKGCVDKIK